MLGALGSCGAKSLWTLESIHSGDAIFDSSRLTYCDPASSLRFEIFCSEGEIAAFLSLTKYKFMPETEVLVALQIEEERVEELLPFLEGKMRLRFPLHLTERIILALQEGKEVAIIVDGFEERLDPSCFTLQFEKLAEKTFRFRDLVKGFFNP